MKYDVPGGGKERRTSMQQSRHLTRASSDAYPAFFAPFGDVTNGKRGPEVPFGHPRLQHRFAVLCHLRRQYCENRHAVSSSSSCGSAYPAFFAPFGDVANGKRGPEVPYGHHRLQHRFAVLCHLRRQYCGHRHAEDIHRSSTSGGSTAGIAMRSISIGRPPPAALLRESSCGVHVLRALTPLYHKTCRRRL